MCFQFRPDIWENLDSLFRKISIILLSLTCRSILALLLLALGKIIRKKFKYDREFQRPFECGFSTFNDFRLKFSLHFFLIALIFIIFDVELILLFPFYREYYTHKRLRSIVLFIMFLFILSLGLFNEWNQIILEWSK